MRWAVIENAGYERENTRKVFKTYQEAVAYRDAEYSLMEAEALHVDIARWDIEGEFWSYDY